MKSKRQNKILTIISQNEVETQEELVRYLNEAGFRVTQATVSRDIKELHLIKVQTSAGIYKYAVNSKDDKGDNNIRIRIFKDTVKTIDVAENLVVIKTLTGSANAAGEVIDSINNDQVLGCIAGDNTIFVAVRTTEGAESLAETLISIKNS